MSTLGLRTGHAPDAIPSSHRDLVECPPVAALTTVMPDGYPQTSVVWCDFDGACVRVKRPIRYVGECIPARFAETEVPVLCRIRPTHVVAVDAGTPETRTGGDPAPVPALPGTLPIPADHLDLLARPICGVLTTMGSDGQPQSSPVWVDGDGACARVNTTLQRQKGRNPSANPKLSLLVVDPRNTGRFLQIRGDAELVTGPEALEHLDALTQKYTRHPRFYGYVCPAAQQARETRVMVRIHPRRVSCDAIHA